MIFSRFLIFLVITHIVSLHAGLKEQLGKQVEKYAPAVLGPLLVPVAFGAIIYPFTKSKQQEIEDLDSIRTTIEKQNEELSNKKITLAAAQTPNIEEEKERNSAKNTIRELGQLYIEIYQTTQELKKILTVKENDENVLRELGNSLSDLESTMETYEDTRLHLQLVREAEREFTSSYSEITKKSIEFKKIFENEWKNLPSEIANVNDMLDGQLLELDNKIEKTKQTRFWPLRRFIRPYAGFSTGNLILYALTAGGVFWGLTIIQALIQKIKNR